MGAVKMTGSYFYAHFQRKDDFLMPKTYFTDEKDLYFERLMQEKPHCGRLEDWEVRNNAMQNNTHKKRGTGRIKVDKASEKRTGA